MQSAFKKTTVTKNYIMAMCRVIISLINLANKCINRLFANLTMMVYNNCLTPGELRDILPEEAKQLAELAKDIPVRPEDKGLKVSYWVDMEYTEHNEYVDLYADNGYGISEPAVSVSKEKLLSYLGEKYFELIIDKIQLGGYTSRELYDDIMHVLNKENIDPEEGKELPYSVVEEGMFAWQVDTKMKINKGFFKTFTSQSDDLTPQVGIYYQSEDNKIRDIAWAEQKHGDLAAAELSNEDDIHLYVFEDPNDEDATQIITFEMNDIQNSLKEED